MKLDRTWRWFEKPCVLLALVLTLTYFPLAAAGSTWYAVAAAAPFWLAQIVLTLDVMWLMYLRAADRTYRPRRGWRPS